MLLLFILVVCLSSLLMLLLFILVVCNEEQLDESKLTAQEDKDKIQSLEGTTVVFLLFCYAYMRLTVVITFLCRTSDGVSPSSH